LVQNIFDTIVGLVALIVVVNICENFGFKQFLYFLFVMSKCYVFLTFK